MDQNMSLNQSKQHDNYQRIYFKFFIQFYNEMRSLWTHKMFC